MDVLLPGRSASQRFVFCQHEKSRQKHSSVKTTRKEARVQAERTFLQRGMTFESRSASSALGRSPSLSPPRASTGTEIWGDDREELARPPKISDRQALCLFQGCKMTVRQAPDIRGNKFTQISRGNHTYAVACWDWVIAAYLGADHAYTR